MHVVDRSESRMVFGDGIGDDTAALQDALDTNSWLVLTEGTYRITSLQMRDRQRLTLDDGARVVRAGTHGMLFNGSGTAGPGGYGRGSNLIEGGIWDLDGVGSSAYVTGIGIGHSDNVTIRNATFLDVAGNHAIEVNSSRNTRIENCRFMGFVPKPGDTVAREAIQIDACNDAVGFAFGPYDLTACDDVQISGCWFGGSDTPGSVPWPRGVGSHGTLDTTRPRHSGIVVHHNKFKGVSNAAVRGWWWDGSSVHHNNVDDSGGDGLILQQCTNVDLESNYVIDSAKNGLLLDDSSSNVRAILNRVLGSGLLTNTTYDGIRVIGNCNVVDVQWNKVRKRSGNGARWGFFADSTVTNMCEGGNRLNSSGNSGPISNSATPTTNICANML